MTPLEPGPGPPRLSDADREHALGVLREGAAQGRLSPDTFVRRMEVILQARWQEELHPVLHDLPERAPHNRWWLTAVGRVSAFPGKVREAWRSQRLPELLLPEPGPYPVLIGRAPGAVLRLNHDTVSRFHARLTSVGNGWLLQDLGSRNGTWVNGGRVTGAVPVRVGDEVRFGQEAFRLTAPGQADPPAVPPLPKGPPPGP
ncbi:FHA domain-containing protein [Streptomyces sp. NPDC048172]|uniref:FHA domain-containing protein n=1 Tax=Streptomyces sp. NPDC048172 TaxID=3365505 RepID=UPI0037194A11